jgi:predicted DNA-binding ribbon-helix-helix protein
MKAAIAKRSIIINGHRTSISLEDQFWLEIKAIAAERQLTFSQVVSMVDHQRGGLGNLSSALRCFVLARYYDPAASAASQRQASTESSAAADDATTVPSDRPPVEQHAL